MLIVVTGKNFPNWDELYSAGNIEKLPWYSLKLDEDLASELTKRSISGGRILDLGTGPATQAKALADLGFEVTATDISTHAVDRAKGILPSNVKVLQDDILTSHLQSGQFEYVFDRGCFHVLSPSDRPTYVAQVARLLQKEGILFLKTFSSKEQRADGPYRFSMQEIKDVFSPRFVLEGSKESVYQGTLSPLPLALFTVLSKTH